MAGNNLVQSLERGLNILERVARAENGMGVRELAEALGLKPSTVHNLMRTLTARGYLSRSEEPVRYRLGPAVADLSGRLAPRPVAVASEPELLALQVAFPEVVFTLAESSHYSVAVSRRVSPDRPGLMQRPAAHILPPYSSASALLFLAHWIEENRSGFELLHPFWESATPLWKTTEALAHFLAEARRMGMVVTCFNGESIVKTSLPVRNQGGAMVAALGAAAPDKSLTTVRRKKLIDAMQHAAGRLTSL